MKKIKNKVNFLLVFVIIFNCFAIKVSAMEKLKYAEEISVANEFIKNVLKQNSYNRIIELYDMNEVVNYLFFDLGQNGYVIVSIEHNHVVEGSSNSNQYFKETNEKYYYNGPLQYYKENEDILLNLCSGETVSKSKIKKVTVDTNYLAESNISTRAGETEYEVLISNKLWNLSYNPNGICGSTAAAMYLIYLDINVNDNYVADEFESFADAPDFIATLKPYIDGLIPGSTVNDMKSGLQRYINTRNISHTVVALEYSSSRIKTRINGDRPAIVGLDNHPTYGDHWVTASGYYIATSATVAYVIVNDGWGGVKVYINPQYIDYIVY